MTDVSEVLANALNDRQRAAATETAAETVTLACAGSGKSRTLAYRIAWLIADQGADPTGIVAFTFTEKAADSIKLRVADALQRCGLDVNLLGRMYIGTIHSFCQYLLGQVDAAYRQHDVLDDNKLKLFLMEKYGMLGLHRFRQRFSNSYFKTIQGIYEAWLLLNEEQLKIDDIAEHEVELAECLRDLREAMLESRFIDFSLMQRLAVEELSGNSPAVEVAAEPIQHLLVDEYQDINPIQDALIQQLHERSETLFVVGDDDQSIYGWRGADVSRIQTFTDRYPDAATHTLSVNYRSTPLIVRTADHFAHQELGAARIIKNPEAPETDQPNEFRTLWFDTRDDEADWVVAKINELLGTAYRESDGTVRGLTPADFAILMRSTRQPEPNNHPPRHVAYTARLTQSNIPYSLEAGGGLFDRPHVQVMRAAFDLLREGQPTRDDVQAFVDESAGDVFPNTDFTKLTRVFTSWGRDIHAPVVGGARRRIYPQNLVFELLEAFGAAQSNLDEAVWQDLGVFSRIIQDVESVYPSVDSTSRFQSILNFLNVVAEAGYDTSSSEVLQRPDAVTVSTVHKMKGLEFPVVFVVDVENNRFPGRRKSYRGIVPEAVLAGALERGAYQGTREEEARLFYTAITRAERFLYVTGSAMGPGWKRAFRSSSFVAHLQDDAIISEPDTPTDGLLPAPQARRLDAANLPTSFSDIRYYLRCPKDYQYRKLFGFSPAIPDLFGFGMTVHAAIGKLHQEFSEAPPTTDDAVAIASNLFHLKHVIPSRDPEGRPGPYERAKNRARELVVDYADRFSDDFRHRRQVEARFEIPIEDAVVSGAIDLMLKEDEAGNIIDACVIDFKTMEGGADPQNALDLEWTELSLQVQLYAAAARDVLGAAVEAGYVHLLKDGQRVQVPTSDEAIGAALQTIEWAVGRIIHEDFPMRPEKTKCEACDFFKLCPRQPESFATDTIAPEIHVPGQALKSAVAAFREFDPEYE
ncbi:MAG: ATP-dependent DNA helicase [Oceanicaulis sp.]